MVESLPIRLISQDNFIKDLLALRKIHKGANIKIHKVKELNLLRLPSGVQTSRLSKISLYIPEDNFINILYLVPNFITAKEIAYNYDNTYVYYIS